jgi:hypothetical protein
MKTISKEQARSWCETRAINTNGSDKLHFDASTPHSFAIPIEHIDREDLILLAFMMGGFSTRIDYHASWFGSRYRTRASAMWFLARRNCQKCSGLISKRGIRSRGFRPTIHY